MDLSVLFYATPFLVRMCVSIEWRWDCYQLTDQNSSFLRSLVKISRSLSYFGIFIANKEEGVSQLFLRILPKKKKLSNQKSRCAHTRHCFAMPVLYVFLMSSYMLKMFFISHIWEVNDCTAWVKPVLKLQRNSLKLH